MEHIFGWLIQLFIGWPRLGLLLVAGIAGLIVALVILAIIRVRVMRFVDLYRRGWTVDWGSGGVAYVERVNGRLESMTFRQNGAPPDLPYGLYVPREDAWNLSAPGWTRGRRDEIVGRVRSRLSVQEYTFVDERP